MKIHADPCGRCKKIAPVFASLRNQFSDQQVLFLTFDRTSKGSRKQAELLSQTLGIEDIYEKHRYTGVIVLVSPDGRVKEIVDSDASLAGATEAFTRNLRSI